MEKIWEEMYAAAKAVLKPRRISEYVTAGEVSAALIMKSMGVTKAVWLVGVILELVIVFTVIPINMVSTENQLIKRFEDKEEYNDKG